MAFYHLSSPLGDSCLKCSVYLDFLFHLTFGPWEFLNFLPAHWWMLLLFSSLYCLQGRSQGGWGENLLETEVPCSFSECVHLDFLVWQDGVFPLFSVALFTPPGRSLWLFIRQRKETEIFVNLSSIKIMLCEALKTRGFFVLRPLHPRELWSCTFPHLMDIAMSLAMFQTKLFSPSGSASLPVFSSLFRGATVRPVIKLDTLC